MIWIIKLWVTTVLLSIGYSTQDYDKTIIDCCKLGQDFADRWPSIGCSTSDSTLLPRLNVTSGYFTDCEITFSLCCSSRHQSVNCDLGKSLAQSSTEKCISSISFPRYTEHSSAVYECCQACKLGSIAREEGRSCSLTENLSFTNNWFKSFTECCQTESASSKDDSRERESDSSETKSICENGYHDSNERCKCNKGYKLNPTGSSCIDIDECVELRRACAPWQSCNNQPGSYNCTNKPVHQLSRFNQYSSSEALCPQGLTRSNSGQCIDIDECVLEPPVCHSTLETCVNILGSYRCERQSPKIDPSQCPAGYRSINSQCIDIDECLIGMHRCKPSIEDCINIPGSYECRPRSERLQSGNCDRGYNRDIDTGLCVDIDECVDFSLCPDTHRCFNMPGTYLCIRKNECGTGYIYNLTSDNCDDIDECESTPTICGSSTMFKCINIPGTYRCTRIACPSGQNLQPDGTCQSIQCPNGFERNSFGKCEDIDECLIPERCPPGHSCINLMGTYQCRSVCESGLRYDANSNTCLDIDECLEGRHNCQSGQTCSNTYRSFSCSCSMGQQLDEHQRCIDIDECAKYGPEVCPVNSICVNKHDSFDCICEKGYRQSKYSQGCVDIDECEETPWVCPHKCVNTQGSYICSCPPGYRLGDDEKTCIDIDECAENIANLALFCEGQCNNTEGSYVCSCSEGFQVRDNRFCDDINECERNKPCGESICLNTIGSYKCFNQDCPEGYIRDTAHTHRCKKPRKAVQCVGDQCYEIYKKPLSYSYSYISLPSDIIIPSSGKLALFTARGPLIPGSEVLFKLNVTSIEADNSTEPAVREDFHLASVYNEAVISLIKPLKGEQLAKLELDLELYQGDLPSGTTKIILMLHISKHSLQKSKRMKLLSSDIRK